MPSDIKLDTQSARNRMRQLSQQALEFGKEIEFVLRLVNATGIQFVTRNDVPPTTDNDAKTGKPVEDAEADNMLYALSQIAILINTTHATSLAKGAGYGGNQVVF